MKPKKSKSTSLSTFRKKPKKNNKGIHAKSKTSNHKKSKHYKKLSVGQG